MVMRSITVTIILFDRTVQNSQITNFKKYKFRLISEMIFRKIIKLFGEITQLTDKMCPILKLNCRINVSNG